MNAWLNRVSNKEAMDMDAMDAVAGGTSMQVEPECEWLELVLIELDDFIPCGLPELPRPAMMMGDIDREGLKPQHYDMPVNFTFVEAKHF